MCHEPAKSLVDCLMARLSGASVGHPYTELMKKIFLCELADAPAEGDGMHIDLEKSVGIALFRQDGKFLAVEDNCPHANAPLHDGTVHRGIVTCAWHDWQFELDSGQSLMSEHICIKAYRIIEEDNALWAVQRTPKKTAKPDDNNQLLGEA
ncbi:Rieske 2Fe-2S domain-containing protein [Planctomycetota bacterium]|nr:Rieske 2Fe-2S domain-containing protein [Planctomycetota bacterium]